MMADIGASKDFEIPLAVFQRVLGAREARIRKYMEKVLVINNIAIATCINALPYTRATQLLNEHKDWMNSATDAISRDPNVGTLKDLASQAVTKGLAPVATMWTMMMEDHFFD
jgi:hypothetical protein